MKPATVAFIMSIWPRVDAIHSAGTASRSAISFKTSVASRSWFTVAVALSSFMLFEPSLALLLGPCHHAVHHGARVLFSGHDGPFAGENVGMGTLNLFDHVEA